MNYKKTSAALSIVGAFALGSVTSNAALFATDGTYGAFDASRSTRTLSIGDSATVTDVNIFIDFAKCDDPAMGPTATTCSSGGEEFSGETFFYLLSPAGTRVDLVWTYSGVGEGVEGGSTKSTGTYDLDLNVGTRIQVTFDDAAGAGVGPVMTTGSFRPEEALSLFNGEGSLGDWTLGMGDSIGADPLSYYSACLSINGAGSCGAAVQVPEPATLALLGLGLVGLGFSRRKKV